jgi:hypothetical protein
MSGKPFHTHNPSHPSPVIPMAGLSTPPPTQLMQDAGAGPVNTSKPVRHEKYYNTAVPDPIVIQVFHMRPVHRQLH